MTSWMTTGWLHQAFVSLARTSSSARRWRCQKMMMSWTVPTGATPRETAVPSWEPARLASWIRWWWRWTRRATSSARSGWAHATHHLKRTSSSSDAWNWSGGAVGLVRPVLFSCRFAQSGFLRLETSSPADTDRKERAGSSTDRRWTGSIHMFNLWCEEEEAALNRSLNPTGTMFIGLIYL